MSDSLPEWNTQLARETLTKRFYNMTPEEFEQALAAGRFEFAKDSKRFQTLMLWYPHLK